MKFLRLILLPYMALGLFAGTAITGKGPHHPATWKEVLILLGMHVFLFGCAWLLAANSKAADGTLRFGLSAGALIIGLFLTYVAGFVISFFL